MIAWHSEEEKKWFKVIIKSWHELKLGYTDDILKQMQLTEKRTESYYRYHFLEGLNDKNKWQKVLWPKEK